jgi:hypothetical protein
MIYYLFCFFWGFEHTLERDGNRPDAPFFGGISHGFEPTDPQKRPRLTNIITKFDV